MHNFKASYYHQPQRQQQQQCSVSCTACPCSSQGSLWEMCNFNSTDFVPPSFLSLLGRDFARLHFMGCISRDPRGRKEGRYLGGEGRGGGHNSLSRSSGYSTWVRNLCHVGIAGNKINLKYIPELVTMMYSPNSGNSRPTLNMIK